MSDLWNKTDDAIRTTATYKLARELGVSHATLHAGNVQKTSGLYAYVTVIDYDNRKTYNVTVYDREVR